MLLAALASVVIAFCYEVDTCVTTAGEKIRLACIDTPELRGKRADLMPAKAAREQLRSLVVGRTVGIRRITLVAMAAPLPNYLWMAPTSSNSWSPPVMPTSIGNTCINAPGVADGNFY